MSDATSNRPGVDSSGAPSLRRTLSLPLVVLYGLGTTVGAGIYALTGVVAGSAGMWAFAAFGIAAVLAGFTAASYAALSSRYPVAAAEVVFARPSALSRFRVCCRGAGWW